MLLNPPNAMPVEEGDEIIVIAEDDDSYSPKVRANHAILNLMTGMTGVYTAGHRQCTTVDRNCSTTRKGSSVQLVNHSHSCKFLFINWRRDMDDMIAQLDAQVPKVM